MCKNSFSERRSQMKKEQDPVERLAFHLVSSRDVALSIANDGLSCEQLSFSLDKYLGNYFNNICFCNVFCSLYSKVIL